MANASAAATANYTKKDFESDQEVRWCPGCGDYSILANVQRFLPTLNRAPEEFVFVSGIGCSSRFPYYMNTYGFHTIHGRAPAIATGVALTQPDLSTWIISGDGDALSIGGNHLLHLLRRNVDCVFLLFNNRIYGLTKGQYSPTSEVGKVTKSTPLGSLDHPVKPLPYALGSQASFVARTLDRDAKHMGKILEAAYQHKGCSFVEIFQNCNIFNDGAWDYMAERSLRADAQVELEHGKLMIFGKDRDKGIALEGLKPKVVNFAAGDEQAAEDAGVLRYDDSSIEIALLVSQLDAPEFPTPMGVLYRENRATFDDVFHAQLADAKKRFPISDSVDDSLNELYRSGDVWDVE